MSPTLLFKCLADDLRLDALLLIAQEQELCVCELTEALAQSQPKISRHLAQLRSCGLLLDRRQGQWVFYRINPALPQWVHDTLNVVSTGNMPRVEGAQERLAQMRNRPERTSACC